MIYLKYFILDVNLINFDSANFKRAHHKNGQDMENLKRDLCLLGLEKLQLAKSMVNVKCFFGI